METKQLSNEDLPAWPHHLECFRESLGGRHVTDSCLGASRPRSLPLGMQSLLRMCTCSCVFCIYMYVALRKQPSVWGSWASHVRVSPEPRGPPPRRLKGPASLHLLICQHCCFLQRIMGSSRTLLPSPCLQGFPACLFPRARGTWSPFPTPLLTTEKRIPNHHQAV